MKLFAFLVVSLASCTLRSNTSQSEMKIRFINSQCEQIYLNTPLQLEANFKALYYGPKLNRIDVNLAESYDQLEMRAHFNSVMNIQDANLDFIVGRHPVIAQSNYVRIDIDTTQEISTQYIVNESKNGLGKREICISHYPVIIENIYPSFFKVGYGDELDLIFEAINVNGNWDAISHPPIRFCGTGLQSVSLCSKEIVISALPITQGEFKTKGRIKLGQATSNEIFIAIDSTTFNFQSE